MASFGTQHTILDQAVEPDGSARAAAIRHLTTYFGGHDYTGAHFDSFRSNHAPADDNVITSDDVLAVKMLSVDIPPRACIRILETDHERITALLEAIPNKPIYQVDRSILADTGPANALWKLLIDKQDGVGWVTAGKLLARKRPHLIPVYDRVVKAALQAPKHFWLCMWEYFNNRPDRVAAWEALRDDSPAPGGLSVLRTIDVVLWMRGEMTK